MVNPILPEGGVESTTNLFTNFSKWHFAKVLNNIIWVCQVFYGLSNDTKFVDKNYIFREIFAKYCLFSVYTRGGWIPPQLFKTLSSNIFMLIHYNTETYCNVKMDSIIYYLLQSQVIKYIKILFSHVVMLLRNIFRCSRF